MGGDRLGVAWERIRVPTAVTNEQRDRIAAGIFEYRKMTGHPSWGDVNEGVKDYWREYVEKEYALFCEAGVTFST